MDISYVPDDTIRSFGSKEGLPSNESNLVFIDPDTDEVLLGSSNGFYRYDFVGDTIYEDSVINALLPPGENYIHNFHKDYDGDYWLSCENEHEGWIDLVARKSKGQFEVAIDKPFRRLPIASTEVFF